MIKQDYLEKHEFDGNNQFLEKKEVKWLIRHIAVKIMDRNLSDGEYYKQKGEVSDYEGLYAFVKLESSGDIIKIHQN